VDLRFRPPKQKRGMSELFTMFRLRVYFSFVWSISRADRNEMITPIAANEAPRRTPGPKFVDPT